MRNVKANKYDFSVDKDLIVKVSQCAAFAVADQVNPLVSIAHLHIKSDVNKMLDEMFNVLTIKGLSNDYMLSACGGVYAFIPDYGPVLGELIADDVENYIVKNNLESHVSELDLYTDKYRSLIASPINKELKIIIRKDNTFFSKASFSLGL